MSAPLEIRLPGGPSPEVLEALRAQPTRRVRMEVPEAWCYRIQWPAPPGGWSRRQQDELRPGLVPESLEHLHWDEAVDGAGQWSFWALPAGRLEAAVAPFADLLWMPGRKVRVFPAGHGASRRRGAFPDLAPAAHRARRLPWRRMGRWAAALLPLLGLGAAAWVGGRVLLPRWRALEARRQAVEVALAKDRAQLLRERQLLQQLRGLASGRDAQPAWVGDLDALTRLLPEDSRLVGLKWEADGLQIDLVTPNPEIIRGILEASPEFKEVRFQGNLERHGSLSRLILLLRPEGR